MSPLVLLAMPVVAPAVLMQTVVLCSLFPYICIPVFTASSVVMGATLTKAATMKIKWVCIHNAKDIQYLLINIVTIVFVRVCLNRFWKIYVKTLKCCERADWI